MRGEDEYYTLSSSIFENQKKMFANENISEWVWSAIPSKQGSEAHLDRWVQ